MSVWEVGGSIPQIVIHFLALVVSVSPGFFMAGWLSSLTLPLSLREVTRKWRQDSFLRLCFTVLYHSLHSITCNVV